MNPKVRQLYKQMFYIARQLDYPAYKIKLKRAFFKNAHLSDDKLEHSLLHGRFVMKELEALWFLKKYRTMRRNYLED
jgi:hypothetical protein